MPRYLRVSKHLIASLRFSATFQHNATRASCPNVQAPTLKCGERHFQSLASHRQEIDEANQASVKALQNISIAETQAYNFANSLPRFCPGCGAPSQTIEHNTPGFYSPRASRLKSEKCKAEDKAFQDGLERLAASGHSPNDFQLFPPQLELHKKDVAPICDRCHYLLYQSKGEPILHPSVQSIRAMIEDSPHRHNHIYHILDAADFPMSLITNLTSALNLPRPRTQNRRSKSDRFMNDRTADVSFIITRSDLLAPKLELAERMLPDLQEALRDALGRSGKNLRLGNVRLVSAHRGWWTPVLKEEIWTRGGAGWMVGRVNVGKSALFEAVYPKGRNFTALKVPERIDAVEQEIDGFHEKVITDNVGDQVVSDSETRLLAAMESDLKTKDLHKHHIQDFAKEPFEDTSAEAQDNIMFDESENSPLLPPAQTETRYPHMPLVSALPGTTASAIRIPYGKGKGELIDLPGVHRSLLETHVKEEHRSTLIMKSRIVPQRHTILPGQSLLLGGMIRITPKTGRETFLAFPFVTLHPHVTRLDKARAIQTGVDEDGISYAGRVENIASETAKQQIQSAGTFRLEWDVTKRRAGPLTSKDAGKMKAENLPFIVYGADILIESVGWVELVCQVRKTRENPILPEVEIFTPTGKFIAIRKPLNAWLVGGPKKAPKHLQKSRPRMTISMQRRKEGGKKGSMPAAISTP